MRTLAKIAALILAGLALHRLKRRLLGAKADQASVSGRDVRIPETPDADERRPKRKRTGDTQKLERRIVHGPYRPIGDPGPPSEPAPPEPAGDEPVR